MRKRILIILGAILVLFAIPFILYKIGPVPTKNLPVKNSTPSLTSVDLCAKFPKVQGEISCEEAKAIALAKYPGKIANIDLKKESISTQSATPVWLLTVILKDPIPIPLPPQKNGPLLLSKEKAGTIEVAREKVQGEFLFYRIPRISK